MAHHLLVKKKLLLAAIKKVIVKLCTSGKKWIHHLETSTENIPSHESLRKYLGGGWGTVLYPVL